MDEKPEFQDKNISPQILKYYKLNEVSRFLEDKPYHKGQKDKENEIKTLWLERKIVRTRDSLPGMLQWSPVVEHEITQLTPLDNAIGKKHALKKYDQFPLNTSCFWGEVMDQILPQLSCAISRNFYYK